MLRDGVVILITRQGTLNWLLSNTETREYQTCQAGSHKVYRLIYIGMICLEDQWLEIVYRSISMSGSYSQVRRLFVMTSDILGRCASRELRKEDYCETCMNERSVVIGAALH